MSGICDTCKRNKECRKPMYGMDSCRLYISGKESNYDKLFGTPEKAANILALGCMGASENVCDSCVFRECDGKLRRCGSIHSIATQMLEWLRGDAE